MHIDTHIRIHIHTHIHIQTHIHLYISLSLYIHMPTASPRRTERDPELRVKIVQSCQMFADDPKALYICIYIYIYMVC